MQTLLRGTLGSQGNGSPPAAEVNELNAKASQPSLTQEFKDVQKDEKAARRKRLDSTTSRFSFLMDAAKSDSFEHVRRRIYSMNMFKNHDF